MVKGFFLRLVRYYLNGGKIQTTFRKIEIVQCLHNVTQELHGVNGMYC